MNLISKTISSLVDGKLGAMIGAGVLPVDADRVINSTAIKVKMHVRSGRKKTDEKANEKTRTQARRQEGQRLQQADCNGGWQRDGSGLEFDAAGKIADTGHM